MAASSSILARKIPYTGEPGGLPSVGSPRVGHNRAPEHNDSNMYRTGLLPSSPFSSVQRGGMNHVHSLCSLSVPRDFSPSQPEIPYLLTNHPHSLSPPLGFRLNRCARVGQFLQIESHRSCPRPSLSITFPRPVRAVMASASSLVG
ncbi:unnamed protein product [Rangifer tarandus platyrhynchus]|uniref:Uncharacterized protein n=1 Tax=Rangifer tarandus platyrhynchus TaxID=3082113 RepID=A0AC59ZYG5_RANTA